MRHHGSKKKKNKIKYNIMWNKRIQKTKLKKNSIQKLK